MENSTSFIADDVLIEKSKASESNFYAVYDSCNSKDVPGWELAFIEERCYDKNVYNENNSDEEYFCSLKDAKSYANIHFQSGGEYFSLQQLSHPDNFLYIVTDKIKYLMA